MRVCVDSLYFQSNWVSCGFLHIETAPVFKLSLWCDEPKGILRYIFSSWIITISDISKCIWAMMRVCISTEWPTTFLFSLEFSILVYYLTTFSICSNERFIFFIFVDALNLKLLHVGIILFNEDNSSIFENKNGTTFNEFENEFIQSESSTVQVIRYCCCWCTIVTLAHT